MTDLRKALAQSEKPPVKTYCGGKANYCTPEVTPDVDAVNISQERVDETAKREHEPVAWFVQYEYRHEFLWRKPNELEQKTALEIKPLYTAPPISDYHEGWEEGFKAAKREHEPWQSVQCTCGGTIYFKHTKREWNAALAQPEQEPVAWMYVNTDGECEQIEYGEPFDDPSVTPLYTAPPKREWVGLTDEDKDELLNLDNWTDIVEAVEAKLKEKNT